MRIHRRVTDPQLFMTCLLAALEEPELLAQFERLTGYDVRGRGPAIVQAIDRTTGHWEAGVRAFYEFVVDAIYLPMQADADRSSNVVD
jgi:hypothetical protein